jgi:hypothetical protein
MIKPIINEIEPPKLTDDDIVSFTQKEWLQSPRNDYNKLFNANKVFAILLKQGKLKFQEHEMLEIIKIVREDNLQKMNKLYGLDAKNFRESINNNDFVDTQCKKLALVKYFEGLSS